MHLVKQSYRLRLSQENKRLNKSRLARDFYRKVFNDNIVNLQDADARKEIVDQFFSNPENKKAGWHRTKDRRFFRSAFLKICKENNFNPMSIGVTPEPARAKTIKGSMNLNVKSKQKNPPPLEKPTITTEQIKQSGKAPITNLPTTATLQGQQQQATYYSAQSVGAIFETLFNIIHARSPSWSPLSQNEKIAMGEAWSPIFNQYLSGKNEWVMPVVVTAPILLQRLAELQREKKEKELKEKYGLKDKEFKPQQEKQKTSKWNDMGFGKNETQ